MNIVKFIKTPDIADQINILFESEKKRLLEFIPSVDIQHIGGTSIPDSISKGDLDINVRVKKEDFNETVKRLKNIYEVNQPENWTNGFASFKDDLRDLGVQVTTIGGSEDYFITQRDYLRNHPNVLEELNILKQKFEGKDMDEYRHEKSRFFDNLNSEIALKER
ncbi:MAG: GrpB family protein [Proteobacteria bacterium]|nr:GrpB family protein [Pseudomonadota bacterium]